MADPEDTEARIEKFFSNSRANKIFGWFRLIISVLLSFSFVENEAVRENVRQEPIAVNTFLSHLPRITKIVERKVDLQPDKFVVLFDGWSCGSTHYIGILNLSLPPRKTGIFFVFLLFLPCETERDSAPTFILIS